MDTEADTSQGGDQDRLINKLWSSFLDYCLYSESMVNLGVNSLCEQPLSPDQTSLLSKGLKFIPVPSVSPHTFRNIFVSFSNLFRQIQLKWFSRNAEPNSNFDPKFRSTFTPDVKELDKY